MPKLSPLLTTREFLIVTLEAVMSTFALTEINVEDRPGSVDLEPPSTGSQCQPGPLETWPGTVRNVVPAGTPVLEASG